MTSPEPALEPDLPIVDAHHHLGPVRGRDPYLIADLHKDARSVHEVRQSVYVECGWAYRCEGPVHLRPVGETEMVAALAEASTDVPAVVGIVAFADLFADRIDDVLDAHLVAGAGLLKGVRYAIAFDEDPRIPGAPNQRWRGMSMDPRFRRGLRRLADRGLVFDAWAYHHQLQEIAALAQAMPEVRIVVDHMGGILGVGPYAGRRDQILASWRIGIDSLAACANVTMKLGGIGMAMFGMGYETRRTPPLSAELVADWRGPIEYVIERFGVERCMFESNFPVDKISCSYVTLWNAFKLMTTGASLSDRSALFGGTAIRTYQL